MNSDSAAWASLKAEIFVATNDPMRAIESFLLAREVGFVPPEPVLAWIENAFREWYRLEGRSPMDELMGLQRKQGQDPWFKQALIGQRDDMLLLDMLRLQKLGLTIDEFASAVASKLQNSAGWDKTEWNLGNVASETLKKKFKSWCTAKERAKLKENLVVPETYLSQFPDYAIPPKYKNKNNS